MKIIFFSNHNLFDNFLTDNLYLTTPDDFHYLNQSNCTGDVTLDDVKDWQLFDVRFFYNFKNIIKQLKFEKAEQKHFCLLLYNFNKILK